MYSKIRLRTKLDVLGYTFPIYHEGKKSYVDFQYIDPRTGAKRRKKYHLDNHKKLRERRMVAKLLISDLTVKLMSGWLPVEEIKMEKKCEVTITDCLDKYQQRIESTGRKKSCQAYRTYMSGLCQFFGTLQNPPVSPSELDEDMCCAFLDWLVEDRGVNARTRNNYRSWLGGFCTWMISRKYIKDNPVSSTDKLPEDDKIRKSLTRSQLIELFEYLKENDQMFLLAVMMEYYTFIRPKELHYIKIGDINVKEQRIFVNKKISKNKRDGNVALNETLILQMIDCGIFNYPPDYYIFGSGLKPGPKIGDYNLFSRNWEKVRKKFGWGKELKFYSLKDSGIRDLANKEGIVTARNQARHTDISTTNKYLDGCADSAPEEAKHFKGFIG